MSMLCFTPPNTLACRHAGNSWFPPAKILYQNTICKFFYMKMFAPAENKRPSRLLFLSDEYRSNGIADSEVMKIKLLAFAYSTILILYQ